jgi:hypothetical protein
MTSTERFVRLCAFSVFSAGIYHPISRSATRAIINVVPSWAHGLQAVSGMGIQQLPRGAGKVIACSRNRPILSLTYGPGINEARLRSSARRIGLYGINRDNAQDEALPAQRFPIRAHNVSAGRCNLGHCFGHSLLAFVEPVLRMAENLPAGPGPACIAQSSARSLMSKRLPSSASSV